MLYLADMGTVLTVQFNAILLEITPESLKSIARKFINLAITHFTSRPNKHPSAFDTKVSA